MKRFPDAGALPRALMVAALGVFSLVAQTLLFRDYLLVFEGNELAIGSFFGSWLLWIMIGAWGAGRTLRLARRVMDRFELLPLLYLPAFVLQQTWIQDARVWAGVASFELFPLVRLLPTALLVTAPVSLITGWLFPLACHWVSSFAPDSAVSRVYIFESLGSFAGGLAVTGLLAAGVPGETIVLLAGALLAAAAAWSRLCKERAWLNLALIAFALLVLAPGVGKAWRSRRDVHAWTRLLPASAFRGSFITPQARYLYGMDRGQFNVLAWESIAETVPEMEYSSSVAALMLAQHPDARRFLVVGPGAYTLCQALLRMPQVERVTWLHPDPEYPRRLLEALPAELRADPGRLELPEVEVRRYLCAATEPPYDTAILALPSATTLSVNRYFTLEFYRLVRARLADDGIIAVRVPAGENYLDGALAGMGASAYHTLGRVFTHRAIKPGDESWLFASEADSLSEEADELRQRFAALPGAVDLYPPEVLPTLFPSDRIAFQKNIYERTLSGASPDEWLNTDARPGGSLYSLMLLLRQTGLSAIVERLPQISCRGWPLVWMAAVLMIVLRALYKRRDAHHRDGLPDHADTHWLVFSTGLAAMALNVVLLYLFQARAGTLFLHVGLLSALFMLGLSLGAIIAVRSLRSCTPAARGFLLSVLLLESILLALLIFFATRIPTAGLAACLLVAGLLQGTFIPLAARWLSARQASTLSAGSLIESFDHLGGALGGWGTSLILLPLWGGARTSAALAALLLTNLPALLKGQPSKVAITRRLRVVRIARALGYLSIGVAVFLLMAAPRLRPPPAVTEDQSLVETVRAWRPEAEIEVESVTIGDESRAYARVRDGEETLFAFNTRGVAPPEAAGYGGPIVLVALMHEDGRLAAFRILENFETPDYLEMTSAWQEKLVGRNLLQEKEIDGVSGATMTSLGIWFTLQSAGRAFAKAIGLSHEADGAPTIARPFPIIGIGFLAAACAVLILRSRPTRWGRRIVLIATLLLFGVWLNLQYSLDHVFSLVTGRVLPSLPFWPGIWVLALPVLVAVFGNFYCGYLCPFGAAQELIGDLVPQRFHVHPRPTNWQYARWMKYGLLFVFVAAYAVSVSPRLASTDVLGSLFSPQRTRWILAGGAVMLGVSLFSSRFWCRNLCPAGAFLSLWNGLRLVPRLRRPVRPNQCPFGVLTPTDLDCLDCDRCRMGQGIVARAEKVGWAKEALYFSLVALSAILLLGQALRSPASARAPAGVDAAGRPVAPSAIIRTPVGNRPANVERIRALINRGRLSDREALYYRRLSDDEVGPVSTDQNGMPEVQERD